MSLLSFSSACTFSLSSSSSSSACASSCSSTLSNIILRSPILILKAIPSECLSLQPPATALQAQYSPAINCTYGQMQSVSRRMFSTSPVPQTYQTYKFLMAKKKKKMLLSQYRLVKKEVENLLSQSEKETKKDKQVNIASLTREQVGDLSLNMDLPNYHKLASPEDKIKARQDAHRSATIEVLVKEGKMKPVVVPDHEILTPQNRKKQQKRAVEKMRKERFMTKKQLNKGRERKVLSFPSPPMPDFTPRPELSNIPVPAMDIPVVRDLAAESELVLRSISLANASKKDLYERQKQEYAEKLQRHSRDVGSSEVQAARFTVRIHQLAEHVHANKHDHVAKKNMEALLNQRRRMLMYLKRKDLGRYFETLKILGLKSIVPVGKYDAFTYKK